MRCLSFSLCLNARTHPQITFVNPHFTPEEDKRRADFIDKTTNLTAFKFSTPFTKGGKSHGSLLEQMKKTTICCVERPFPCFVTRQRVVRKEETGERGGAEDSEGRS